MTLDGLLAFLLSANIVGLIVLIYMTSMMRCG